VNRSSLTGMAAPSLRGYAAAAGAAESRVRWEVCLQGFGVLSKDTLLCGKGEKEL